MRPTSGTLRYLLAVPVHRTRMLAVKYAAIVIFAVRRHAPGRRRSARWSGWSCSAAATVTLLSGSQVSFGEGLLRLLAVCGYLAVGLAALGAIGLFVSTLTEQPIGATIAIVMLTVASFILDAIPQLEWLHPYLLTHWWLTFGDLLRDPVAFDGIRQGLSRRGVHPHLPRGGVGPLRRPRRHQLT